MKKTKEKTYYGITGATGEFFVAAEISRRGAVATLTLKNTPKLDVLATNLKNGKFANIQVKTRSKENTQGWKFSNKAEERSKIQNHFYVFVNLKEDKELPDYYIIPYGEFARFIRAKHKRWLAMADRDGKPHKDNSIRNFKPESNSPFFEQDVLLGKKYKENWKILGIF